MGKSETHEMKVNSAQEIIHSWDLAQELACKAQHLKTSLIQVLNQEKNHNVQPLRKVFTYFNRSFIQLTTTQFADAYAQTVTYVMFVASDFVKPLLGSGEEEICGVSNMHCRPRCSKHGLHPHIAPVYSQIVY